MFIKQLSVFVENKPGRLEAIIDTLSAGNVNLRALSIADTTDFGILRIIADDTAKAKDILKDIGVVSKESDVLAVSINDTAGGLAAILSPITKAHVNIEYMYAFLGRAAGKALMVIKTDDDVKAQSVLEGQNADSLSESGIL